MIVEFNGQIIPRRKWTPFIHRVVRRMARLERRHRIRSSGVLLGAATMSSFTKVLRINTSGVGATETQPDGAAQVAAACWGSGAGGGGGSGSLCNSKGGGGGGGGGRAYTASIVAEPNKTFTYTVGAAVAANTNGNASSIANGTAVNLPTMTANGGTKGATASGAPGAGGAGGTASGGVTSNTTGTAGAAGQAGGGGGGAGGAGLGTVITSDGAPYGGGGKGATDVNDSDWQGGLAGAVVFLYT
jgi:hypothetical protein